VRLRADFFWILSITYSQDAITDFDVKYVKLLQNMLHNIDNNCERELDALELGYKCNKWSK